VALASLFTFSCLAGIFAIAYIVGQDPNATLWRIALFVSVATAVLLVPAAAVATILHKENASRRAIWRWTSLSALGVSFVSLFVLAATTAM